MLSFVVLSMMCSRLGCVESLPISLGTGTFSSRFGICDASDASDFDILTFMQHLFNWMRFSIFASQTISCALILSTHSSRGR